MKPLLLSLPLLFLGACDEGRPIKKERSKESSSLSQVMEIETQMEEIYNKLQAEEDLPASLWFRMDKSDIQSIWSEKEKSLERFKSMNEELELSFAKLVDNSSPEQHQKIFNHTSLMFSGWNKRIDKLIDVSADLNSAFIDFQEEFPEHAGLSAIVLEWEGAYKRWTEAIGSFKQANLERFKAYQSDFNSS
ncbi:MAG: hypothetical protein OXN83_02855 [Oligoflexia bacterium]|nr:hypothetical protein [Oligoflexia bacterium]